MRIRESGIDRTPDTPTTSNTPITPNPTLTPSPRAPTTINTTTAAAAAAAAATTTTTTTTPTTTTTVTEADTTDLSCPRKFTSRIGLVGHLRIHRPETGEPGPEAPTYTRRNRLHCPHCSRT
nr:unnamed protein product [Spirometra erinaceieuropaei]